MKMQKKIVTALLIATMAVGSLAGCSKGSQSSNGADTGKETAGSDKVTTVTVWTGMSHNKEYMDEKVNEWNQTVGKEKNIKIEYEVKDNINDMLEVAFTSDQAPDMFPLGDIEKFVTEGRLAAIEDLPGGAELIAKFDGKLANYKHIYNGKTYILPNGATTYGLVYNKDMFKAAGIVDENGEAKPPETLEELRADAKLLTNTDKNEYGIVFPGKYSDWYSDDTLKPSSASTGYLDYNPVTGLYDYSGVATVMETLMGIKADGSYLPGVEGLDNDPARARFSEGGIGMYFSASYDYGVFTDQFPAKVDWGVAPYPVADKNTAHKQLVGYNRYIAINKKSVETKGAENIMEVYKWFYSDEMIIDSYKKGYALPTDTDLVKDVKLDENQKQWGEFASLLDVSAGVPMQMPVDISSERTMQQIWLEDIWSGKVPADQIQEICEKQASVMNAGIEKYKELHPDFDPSAFIVSDWDTQSKR